MTQSLLATNPEQYYAHLVPAFAALLALGGQVGLPILVLTCLRSKRLNRHPTFVNCCVTSIIYSLVFCMLLVVSPFMLSSANLTPTNSISMGTGLYRIYSGQYRRAEPNHALCVAQASMVMAVLPMCICPNPRCSRTKTDAFVGCPLLSSCLCFGYVSQFWDKYCSRAHRQII